MTSAGGFGRLRHPSHRYDDDLVLKVPLLLWLALVFLVRHVLLLGITFMPTTGEEIEVLRHLARPAYVLADLPAALVMLAGMKRRRPCAAWVARIWRFGREILTGAILLYYALVAWTLSDTGRALVDAIDEWLLTSLLLCLAILAYLWRSPLIADVMLDCPERED